MTFKGGLVRKGRHCGRWTPIVRKLDGYAATVALKLKGLEPHALMALVVPEGVMTAPLLWFYRRQKKGRALRLPVSQPVEPPSYANVVTGDEYESNVKAQKRWTRIGYNIST